MSKGFFISGTDTDVGKTVISAILVQKLDAIYYKPIQCGVDLNGDIDSDIIKRLCSNPKILNETYKFKNALSPNIASQRENIIINHLNFKNLENMNREVIVEGAGGLQVPINNEFYVSDLPILFNLPIILVCKTELGTINHTLMSIETIKNKKIVLAGLVFNGKKNLETTQTILNFGEKIYGKEIKVIANIPYLDKLNLENIKSLISEFNFEKIYEK